MGFRLWMLKTPKPSLNKISTYFGYSGMVHHHHPVKRGRLNKRILGFVVVCGEVLSGRLDLRGAGEEGYETHEVQLVELGRQRLGRV